MQASLGVLVTETNKYLGTAEAPKILFLQRAAKYVDKILRVLGVVEDNSFGFGAESGAGASREAVLEPVIGAMSIFRDQVTPALNGVRPSASVKLGCCFVALEDPRSLQSQEVR